MGMFLILLCVTLVTVGMLNILIAQVHLIYMCVRVCLCVYIYVYIYIYTPVCTCCFSNFDTWFVNSLCLRMYVHTYIHTDDPQLPRALRMCILHIYTYIHTHTHTYRWPSVTKSSPRRKWGSPWSTRRPSALKSKHFSRSLGACDCSRSRTSIYLLSLTLAILDHQEACRCDICAYACVYLCTKNTRKDTTSWPWRFWTITRLQVWYSCIFCVYACVYFCTKNMHKDTTSWPWRFWTIRRPAGLIFVCMRVYIYVPKIRIKTLQSDPGDFGPAGVIFMHILCVCVRIFMYRKVKQIGIKTRQFDLTYAHTYIHMAWTCNAHISMHMHNYTYIHSDMLLDGPIRHRRRPIYMHIHTCIYESCVYITFCMCCVCVCVCFYIYI